MTRFPTFHATLAGERLTPSPINPLRSALAEQVERGGRGSEIAAAKLAGIVAAQLAAVR